MIRRLLNSLRSLRLWLLLALVVSCIALQYTGLANVWRFDRQAIAQGSWWLLLTGNFVHLGFSHLWMNMAGLILVATLVWHHFNMLEWSLILVVSSIVVGVGLYLFDPDIHYYVGFSGTLHGLIVAGAVRDLGSYPRSAALLLALITAKLVWEQVSGALPGSESVAGGRVVVNAHLYGAIGGLILAITIAGIKRLSVQTAP